jgi:hypothetical protein
MLGVEMVLKKRAHAVTKPFRKHYLSFLFFKKIHFFQPAVKYYRNCSEDKDLDGKVCMTDRVTRKRNFLALGPLSEGSQTILYLGG